MVNAPNDKNVDNHYIMTFNSIYTNILIKIYLFFHLNQFKLLEKIYYSFYYQF